LGQLTPGESVDNRGQDVLLLGGILFPEPIFIWWNFVARTTAEIDQAYNHWQTQHSRFGPVHSALDRIPAPTSPWSKRAAGMTDP
jgi:hypothetical protein